MGNVQERDVTAQISNDVVLTLSLCHVSTGLVLNLLNILHEYYTYAMKLHPTTLQTHNVINTQSFGKNDILK